VTPAVPTSSTRPRTRPTATARNTQQLVAGTEGVPRPQRPGPVGPGGEQPRRGRDGQRIKEAVREGLAESTITADVELDGERVNRRLNRTERRSSGYRRGSE